MPITDYYQGEIGGAFTLADEYSISRDVQTPIIIKAETEFEREGEHGAEDGPNYFGARPLFYGIHINQAGDPAAAMTSYRALAVACKASRVETTWDVWLPGFPNDEPLRYYGKPGDLDADYGQLYAGYVNAGFTWRALDPIAYGMPETDGDGTVTNVGDVELDRFTVTIDGNGGVPTLIHAATGYQVAFQDAVGGAENAVVDFKRQRVSIGGVDATDRLSVLSQFFKLAVGSNTISFSGCTGITVDWRAPYVF